MIFLILEKDSGTVRRIIDGQLLPNPLLRFNVTNGGLMLGIASVKDSGRTFVFVSLTEVDHKNSVNSVNGSVPLIVSLYRYEFNDNELIRPTLIHSLPVLRGPDYIFHVGGIIAIGPDNNVYYVVGDGGPAYVHKTLAQNLKDGSDPDGTGGVLRFKLDGKPVGKGIFGNKSPLNLYYAYGIRNAFGMDFDTITGKSLGH